MSHHPSCKESDKDLVWFCNQCGEKESAEELEYCETCNHPLSPCGPQGLGGEPTMDCMVCKLREQLAAEREAVRSLRSQLDSVVIQDIQQLRKELAAEREKVENLRAIIHSQSQLINGSTHKELQKQLAAAKAALNVAVEALNVERERNQ